MYLPEAVFVISVQNSIFRTICAEITWSADANAVNVVPSQLEQEEDRVEDYLIAVEVFFLLFSPQLRTCA